LVDILKPHLFASKDGHFDLHFDDGSAAIYAGDPLANGFMVNHRSGRQPWDILVAAAHQGEMAIMPVGCPAAVTSEDLLVDLPEELRAQARVIRSADDLVRLVEPS